MRAAEVDQFTVFSVPSRQVLESASQCAPTFVYVLTVVPTITVIPVILFVQVIVIALTHNPVNTQVGIITPGSL